MKVVVTTIAILLAVGFASVAEAQISRPGGSLPAGTSSNTQVIYNSVGKMKGEAAFTYNDTSNILFVDGISITDNDGGNGVLLQENTGTPTCALDAGDVKLLTHTSDNDLWFCEGTGDTLHNVLEYETDLALRTSLDPWYIAVTGAARFLTVTGYDADAGGNLENSWRLSKTIDSVTTEGSEDFGLRIRSMEGGSLANHLLLNSQGPAELFSRNSDGGLSIYDDSNSSTTTISVGDNAEDGTVTLPGSGELVRGSINASVQSGTSATLTAIQMQRRSLFHCTNAGGCDLTLPTAVQGDNLCVYDFDGTVGVTLGAAAGDLFVLPSGTSTGAADHMVSTTANAKGDFICIVAVDATNWVSLQNSGTWTDGGP